MDRVEFKERMDRIDALINENITDEALDLLDSINWRKVHNVNYLLEGAHRYELIGKPNDARELLEVAHERSPMGRAIIYNLALLCAKQGDIVTAMSYNTKFIELAPNDNLKYIIKYRINKAMEVDDRTLISILEELKSNEMMEEWAFELACLYRKTGQIDKCVSVLDEIILWFGEGPYVEKALEMKRLYRPLTEDQEIRYRAMISAGDSIVEIHPGEKIAKDEFIHKTIRIPEIEETTEKYNTQNLQAEIRKNIEEIMKASKMGEVSENMEAIRELVEDVPYLDVPPVQTVREQFNDTQKLDENLKTKFNEYLSEEFDGQISLSSFGKDAAEAQIDGQMTIEDVMERWEKTSRAAKQALDDAQAQQLLRYKEQAIAKANDVLERLMGGEPKDSAMEEKKEEPVEEKAEPRVEENIEENIEEKTEESFEEIIEEIPKAPEAELPEEIGEEIIEEALREEIEEEVTELKEDLHRTLQIPKISAVGEIDGVGFEIPIISAKEALEANKVIAEETDTAEAIMAETAVEIAAEAAVEVAEAAAALSTEEAIIAKADEELKDINRMLQGTIDRHTAPLPIMGNTTANLPLINIDDIDLETPIQTHLTDREKEILSYFATIQGMEGILTSLITGTRTKILQDRPLLEGHIVITGEPGSGKTRLATNIVQILREETGKLQGNIGRIDGKKLNQKDIRLLYEKVRGGVLIIENAGMLTKDTIVNLNLFMESDTETTLVIIEDVVSEAVDMLNSDSRFSKKFTHRVSIPFMTIDELVSFGKIYAAENGYGIDDMGVLALYDRINALERPEGPAMVADVCEILDAAMDNRRGVRFKGLFTLFSRGGEETNRPLLQERDFMEE